MDTVNLGRCGLKVSRLCLGCMTYGSSRWRPWVLDEDASLPFFRRAWEAGINFFDTADMYSDGVSEEVARPRPPRAGDPARAGRRRHQGLQPDGRRPPTSAACRASTSATRSTPACKRLQLDYVDLYQIHRFDYDTPIEETLEALDAVVRAGKALYIGASSMFAWQMAKMLHTSDRLGLARFVTMQNHYNLIYREEEREMIPLCRDEGRRPDPVEPAGPRLPGRQSPPQGRLGETSRAKTDDFAQKLYYQDSDFAVVERRDGDRARSAACRTPRWRWPGCCNSRA